MLTRRALDDGVAVTVEVLRDEKTAIKIGSFAEQPNLPMPKPRLLSVGARGIRTAVLFPSWHESGSGPLPVLLDPYGGPHAQRVLAASGIFLTSQWFAEQGFAVVIADGRGTPGRGRAWDRAVYRNLADPVLEDQVDALHGAAEEFSDLDLSHVAIRGWSFGGYLSALAVLRRPDVFHAAIVGPGDRDRLYDTCTPSGTGGCRSSTRTSTTPCSSVKDVGQLQHDVDNDAASPDATAHDGHPRLGRRQRGRGALAAVLLRAVAAGYPHSVLPLSGVTHMTPQEVVAENLLLLQIDFLQEALGLSAAGGGV